MSIVTTKLFDKTRPIPLEDHVVINVSSWNRSDKWRHLSPFYVKIDGKEEYNANPGGVIFENYWQGGKIYPKLYSNEVWTQRHVDSGKIWSYNTIRGGSLIYDVD